MCLHFDLQIHFHEFIIGDNSNNMKMYMEKVILSRIFGNCKIIDLNVYIDYWLNQMCLYIVSTMHHKEEWRRSPMN